MTSTTGGFINTTRSGSGAAFTSSGLLMFYGTDGIRYDYDPASGSSKGVLIENESTNEVLHNRTPGAVQATGNQLDPTYRVGSFVFDPSGSTVWIRDYGGPTVYTYNLSTPFDLSTLTTGATASVGSTGSKIFDYVQSASKAYTSQITTLRQYLFSGTGTAVIQSTASVGSDFAGGGNIYANAWNADGTKLYLYDGGNDDLHQYSLSSAYDISTLSHDKSFNLNSIFTFPAFASMDYESGSGKFYFFDDNGNHVWQCTTTSTGDISGLSIEGTYSMTVLGNSSNNICDSGSRLYNIEGTAGNEKLVEYSLGIPYDIRQFWYVSGASYVSYAQADTTGIDGISNRGFTVKADNSSVRYRQKFTVADDSSTHTARVLFLKDTETGRFPEVSLSLTGGSTSFTEDAQINTSTGDSVERNGTYGTAQVLDFGDWWAFDISIDNNGTGNTSLVFDIKPVYTTTFGSHTLPTGTFSTTFDFSQVENNRSHPSSLIETADSAVTRYRDQIELTKLADFYTGSDYTIILEAQPLYSDTVANTVVLSLDDGTANNRIELGYSSSSYPIATIVSSGATIASLEGSAAATGTANRFALSVSNNLYALSVDGSTANYDTSGSIPASSTHIRFGQDYSGSHKFEGHLREFIFESANTATGDLPTSSTGYVTETI